MILRPYYYKFIRRVVDEKHLGKFSEVKVLADRFLKHYYVTVFEGKNEFGQLKRYFLVENIANPILIELVRTANKKYITFGKHTLRDNLPQDLYGILLANGLFKKTKTANNSNDSSCGIHRLQYCLYINILGYEIHHIDKHKKSNQLKNLVRMKKKFHTLVDSLPVDKGIEISLQQQREQKELIFKKQRQTLAQNDRLIVEILQLRDEMTVKEIEKTLNNKVKKSSIYKNLEFYFYRKEFLEELIAKRDNKFPPLDGNFEKRWENVIEFEEN